MSMGGITDSTLSDSKGNRYTLDGKLAEQFRQLHIACVELANEYILRDAVNSDSPAKAVQVIRVREAHQHVQDKLLWLMFGEIK